MAKSERLIEALPRFPSYLKQIIQLTSITVRTSISAIAGTTALELLLP